MTNIYEKHDKAFKLVSAGALVVNGVQKGTIAFKFPKDGAGRLSCYLHLHGHQMVVGAAGGFGYDKKSAALEAACRALCADCLAEYPTLKGLAVGGDNFDGALKKAGFDYYRAI